MNEGERKNGPENERRFLVSWFDPQVLNLDARKIVQGYLQIMEDESTRVRICDDAQATLARKRGRGEKRLEQEIPTDLESAQFLLESCGDLRVRKHRRVVDGCWELDVFEDELSGITLVELERAEAGGPVQIPPWFTGIDVTDSLSNSHLAILAKDLRRYGQLPAHQLHDLVLPRKRLHRLVLTGAPCSGKTTIMEILRQEFDDQVQFVPEIATILFSQLGVRPANDRHARMRFQERLIAVQRQFETLSDAEAWRSGKRVLVLDRGIADSGAYLSSKQDLESVSGMSLAQIYAQYDRIACLMPAPRDIYDLKRSNNPTRTETYDEAVELGVSVRDAWTGHPHLQAETDPAISWDEKVDSVRRIVKQLLTD